MRSILCLALLCPGALVACSTPLSRSELLAVQTARPTPVEDRVDQRVAGPRVEWPKMERSVTERNVIVARAQDDPTGASPSLPEEDFAASTRALVQKPISPLSVAEQRYFEGRSALASRSFGAAIMLFNRALELDARLVEAWTGLASALEAVERPADAISALRRAVEIVPGSANARLNLGLALLRAGATEDARHELVKARSLSPDDERIRVAVDSIPAVAPRPTSDSQLPSGPIDALLYEVV